MPNFLIKIITFLKRNYFPLIGLIVFLAFFSLLHWNSFNAPFERDEGEYAYSAWLMKSGQTPYLDSFLQKPPLIIYTYYLGHLISPFALWPPRALAAVFTLVVCFLLFFIAKKLYGPRAAWLVLFISPLFLSLPHLTALSANTEKFMLLPLVGLVALFVFRRSQERPRDYFLAGLLAAAAILYKPIALLPTALLLLYWLGGKLIKGGDTKKILKSFIPVIYGGLALVVLVFSYFIFTGAFTSFWRQAVVFNLSYIGYLKEHFSPMFWHYAGIFWQNFWLLLLICPFSLFYRGQLIWLWWGLFLVSLLTVFTSPMGHYYLLLAPFLILIIAAAFSGLWPRLKNIEPEWKEVVFAVFIVLILSVSFTSIGEQFSMKPDELSVWIYGNNVPFVESKIMAEKIKETTKPDDKIFVAGSEPQIYYLSQRKSVSKFDITYPFIINTPRRLEYQKEAITDLENNQPAAVVYSLKKDSGLWDKDSPRDFINYLNEALVNYRLVGGTAWEYNQPVWREGQLNQEQLSRASLLLFVKK
jgi:hypothetical protein